MTRRWLLILLLMWIHVSLLAYSATRHSPTSLEPAFLVSGISHWELGRFELYRVNPPVPRMIAALPVLVMGGKTDWGRFQNHPGSRAEYSVGEGFLKANGARSISLVFWARWVCISFSLVGGWCAFCWSRELYGEAAGMLTLMLWCFEPNLLAHAELVTPDCACWSFGLMAIYAFWRWLKVPTWGRAFAAGLSMGLAELTKMTWLLLFGLWPVLWIAWLGMAQGASRSVEADSGSPDSCAAALTRSSPSFRQLAVILMLALYVLNLGYGFDGVGRQLGKFTFVSCLMSGQKEDGGSGNRFREGWLCHLPVPVPEQYLAGFDAQARDLEDYGRPSFLNGEWKDGGWWYYYLYGLAVKVPCGILLLFVAVLFCRILGSPVRASLRDEMLVIAPALAVVAACSWQTQINEHLRYVFPALALSLVWGGQAAVLLPRWHVGRRPLGQFVVVSTLAYSAVSVGLSYPHHLAYFNEFAGGSSQGWRLLRGSSFDWGQDLLEVARFEASVGALSSAGRRNATQEILMKIARQHVMGQAELRQSGIVLASDAPQFGQALKSPMARRIGLTHVALPGDAELQRSGRDGGRGSFSLTVDDEIVAQDGKCSESMDGF